MGFAKHRTFYIREGWLPKALSLIHTNPYIFTPANREKAIDALGIGKVMVASLRFWMEATGLTREGRGSNGMIEHKVTALGENILKYDPYFEDTNTLWLVHYKLVTQEEFATTWFWFFNHFKQRFFNDTIFINKLEKYIRKELNKKVAISSLKKDYLCLKNTYLLEKNYTSNENPEDILASPLVNLGLITNSGNGFQLHNSSLDNLSSEIVYFSILDLEIYPNEEGEQISFSRLIEGEKSIANIFRLNLNLLVKHLEELAKKEYITIQKGFGHNLITLNRVDKYSVLENVYKHNKLKEINYG